MREAGGAPRSLGATWLGEGRCEFLVWAPSPERVEVAIEGPDGARTTAMERLDHGYRAARAEGVLPGDRYRYRLDGGDVADPASRFQPEGVHGPSAVVDPAFGWTDHGWAGLPLSGYVTYEVHVGTFTPEGTFDAAARHLDDLVDLGVTSLELMPVAQFPGTRNWGYDGVFPWAVQDTYGGPDGLKRLVDACHARGLAVVLDVVHNHLGPEGNVLGRFGPYLSEHQDTPWGPAINFDGPGSREVRRFFIDSALRWLDEFHVDALRLDAIHGIVDRSGNPFLARLADRVRQLAGDVGHPLHLIAESDLGDPAVIRPSREGGLGLDAQWSDDVHHAVHALLTGDRQGYYADFGRPQDVATAYRDGYVLTGQRSAYRGRPHGASTDGIPAERFVVFAQNHDQVGNRPGGERLACLVGFEQLKLAAGLVLLSPFLPLLFMGEEYGETTPFMYFTSHGDPRLASAVARGRRREFAAFGWRAEAPDPQAERTFQRSKVDRGRSRQGRHGLLRDLYQELLRLRREVPALAPIREGVVEAAIFDPERLPTMFRVRRQTPVDEAVAVFNLGADEVEASIEMEGSAIVLDSADSRWGGPGSAGSVGSMFQPWSFVLLHRWLDRDRGAGR